jgi:hypothetical protein
MMLEMNGLKNKASDDGDNEVFGGEEFAAK